MKALILIAFATSMTSPLAAATLPGWLAVTGQVDNGVERRSHHCDTPEQIATNLICHRP
ncbi:MAG: hypothetical protein ABI832_15680 [bacterium]